MGNRRRQVGPASVSTATSAPNFSSAASISIVTTILTGIQVMLIWHFDANLAGLSGSSIGIQNA